MRLETVSIIYEHPRILLGMKKVRFGKGKYNGFGGGIEKGEEIKESAIRETREESAIKLLDPIVLGEILFRFYSKEQNHRVYFIRATKYLGTPKETEEMKPKWFNINDIPYDKMWPDDKYWLPILLQGKNFKGTFKFDLENKIKEYKINILN